MKHTQCDVSMLLTWAPAFCPAALELVTATATKLDELPASALTWKEASNLLCFLPFVLFRFPDHKGAGLLAIVASSFSPKATTPKESLGIPNNANNSTTTATQSHLAVKNRFARSFSQLVASQLVPGDLITMAKSQGILTNMGVDYVVVFRFATTGMNTVCQQSLYGHSQADLLPQQTRKRPESASRSSPKLSLLLVSLLRSAMATTTPS